NKVVATDELWGLHNDRPSFSPDGKYVLFTARKNFETDIKLCRLSDQKVFNLTNTGISESDPVFSPDGKYLYFISDRTHQSSPYGMQDAHLYRLRLRNFDRPFRSDKFDSLCVSGKKDTTTKEEKSKKKTEETLPEVRIDFDHLMSRIERIGPHFG